MYLSLLRVYLEQEEKEKQGGGGGGGGKDSPRWLAYLEKNFDKIDTGKPTHPPTHPPTFALTSSSSMHSNRLDLLHSTHQPPAHSSSFEPPPSPTNPPNL